MCYPQTAVVRCCMLPHCVDFRLVYNNARAYAIAGTGLPQFLIRQLFPFT